MRKVAAVALAIPVLGAVYLTALVRRSLVVRLTGAITLGALVGGLAIASIPPAQTVATPPSTPRTLVATDFVDAVRTGHGLHDPFTIQFGKPMDAASVAAALRMEPDAGYRLSWDATATRLTVAPLSNWAAGTLYTLAIGGGALTADGMSLASSVRALVLTERAGSGTLVATRPLGAETRVDTAFAITLDRPAAALDVRAAMRTVPAIGGIVVADAEGTGRFTFNPSEPLAAGTTYRIWLEGLVDSTGISFADLPSLTVVTPDAPAVVRFRPRTGTADVPRDAAVSVRFTEPMFHGPTEAALHVLVNGAEVKGAISWAEKDTVLVFQPAAAFAYAARVEVRVDATARSRANVPLGKATTGSFTVAKKPVAPKAPPTTSIPRPSGGGGAVSGSWTAVEAYYLRLMNCTRTGGWVTSTGACSSPGGRNVAPLALDAGISAKVSRPYAKLLATRGICSHFSDGNPGDRLRRAGYTSYRWAENLGCRSGNPYSAVLGSHLYFQSEKPYSGGHYVNLMNSAYDRAGIGVWVYAGRVRLAVDFYHP